jgi:hypothetical protein
MWHLPGSVHGYEIEKPTGWKIVPKPGDAIATGNATNRFASGTRHVITQVLMRDEEVATFAYPRERSFRTAGPRPLAIRDRRRIERRATTPLSNAMART